MIKTSFTGTYIGQTVKFVKFALYDGEQLFKVSTLYLPIEPFKKDNETLVIPRQITVDISPVVNTSRISSEIIDEISKDK